jgi:hypothetical protein
MGAHHIFMYTIIQKFCSLKSVYRSGDNFATSK